MTSPVTVVNAANPFSDPEHCDFDLKFESEGDDCLATPSVDLFGRCQTPPDQQSAQLDDAGDGTTHVRKRKMDEEGFVTPATPDIPKSSLRYEMTADYTDVGERQEEGGCMDAENEDPGDSFDEEQQQHSRHPSHVTHNHSPVDDTMTESSQGQQKTRHASRPNVETAAELFEDVAQGTKMLIIQMAQNFRESEDFESMCLGNVEKLLSEALALENSLRHQKDLLQQRLFLISRRLGNTGDQ